MQQKEHICQTNYVCYTCKSLICSCQTLTNHRFDHFESIQHFINQIQKLLQNDIFGTLQDYLTQVERELTLTINKIRNQLTQLEKSDSYIRQTIQNHLEVLRTVQQFDATKQHSCSQILNYVTLTENQMDFIYNPQQIMDQNLYNLQHKLTQIENIVRYTNENNQQFQEQQQFQVVINNSYQMDQNSKTMQVESVGEQQNKNVFQNNTKIKIQLKSKGKCYRQFDGKISKIQQIDTLKCSQSGISYILQLQNDFLKSVDHYILIIDKNKQVILWNLQINIGKQYFTHKADKINLFKRFLIIQDEEQQQFYGYSINEQGDDLLGNVLNLEFIINNNNIDDIQIIDDDQIIVIENQQTINLINWRMYEIKQIYKSDNSNIKYLTLMDNNNIAVFLQNQDQIIQIDLKEMKEQQTWQMSEQVKSIQYLANDIYVVETNNYLQQFNIKKEKEYKYNKINKQDRYEIAKDSNCIIIYHIDELLTQNSYVQIHNFKDQILKKQVIGPSCAMISKSENRLIIGDDMGWITIYQIIP